MRRTSAQRHVHATTTTSGKCDSQRLLERVRSRPSSAPRKLSAPSKMMADMTLKDSPLPVYRSPNAVYSPKQWRDDGKASSLGSHDWSRLPSVIENWSREREANAELDISQVPHGLSTVAWFWQCSQGHRWREAMSGVTASNVWARAPRWKRLAGSWGACRRCVLDAYGLRYHKCGHIDEDLGLASKPPTVRPGWCKLCRDTGPTTPPGTALLADHNPPTSKEENVLRALLAARLPIARPHEANCVVVATTSLGHDRVFPDILIPSRQVAIEYDSPGPEGAAHGPDSYDSEKDAALRAAGWEVIRVRIGLPLLGPYDVAASGPTKTAAIHVIEQYNRILASRDEAHSDPPNADFPAFEPTL